MRRLRDRLNLTQRVVLSVSLGIFLQVFGRAAVLGFSGRGGGWFGYAPNTIPTFGGGSFLVRHPLLEFWRWVLLIVAWTAGSLWLFNDLNRSDAPKAVSRYERCRST